MNIWKKIIFAAVLVLAIFLAFHWALHVVHAEDGGKAKIYFNEACADCSVYLEAELLPVLQEMGISDIEVKDYINDRSFRKELNNRNEEIGIPLELQSHLMVFIDEGKLIFGGHVPVHIMRELWQINENLPAGLLVFQDKMEGHGDSVTDYQVWSPGASAQTYGINEPIENYLRWYEENKSSFGGMQKEGEGSIWGLVLLTGLLDGVNPCAIAVLIFFIAFLFTLQSGIGKIFKYGFIYIAVIYLVYLSIGLGLLKAIIISGEPHLMAKIGAVLVITLGFINIIGYYLPKFPIKLQIPGFTQGALKKWLTKATLPAVVVGAFLVGLCTFPCSGGIYVAIVGLLASRGTFLLGLGYLLAYNLMFILPLAALLLLAGNRHTLGKVAEWQQKTDRGLKFWGGLVMIALGVIILLWFV